MEAALELVVDADSLLTAKEVDELKVARKAEAVDRQRATGSFSAYPLLQSLAEGRRHVSRGDPFTLARQMAVALRVDAPNKGTLLDRLTSDTLDQKFDKIFQDFTWGFKRETWLWCSMLKEMAKEEIPVEGNGQGGITGGVQ